MKKLFTFLLASLSLGAVQSQTTVYETGQNYTDAWTGWTAPVTSNVSGSSVNGVNIYTFTLSGGAGASYSLETTRAFSIASNDIDLYLAATTQNATLSIEYSEDNSAWTSIGSLTYGAGFSQQSLVIPSYAPGPTNFYLKLKMTGTVGSPSQAQFNNLKIDADLASESVSVSPSSTQNILTSANGTALTASEVPSAANSREWKYTTTSGSGYTSFTTAETGTTYTPNFATAGTYYVICESNFNGNTEVSNEVQINVTETSGVEELTTSKPLHYTNNRLTIVTSQTDYQISIYNLSGQLVLQEHNLMNFDFTNLENGIYFVNMVSNTGEKQTLKVVKH